MSEVKDTLLEEAMAGLKSNSVKNTRIKKNKVNAQQRRAMDSLKSMILISRLRKDGWDWIRMAKKLNVSEQTIRNWATGKNTPHPNNLLALRKLENGKEDLSTQEPESNSVEY